MKEMNNKGFMMAEIIVVAVVIVIGLVGLFTTFTKTFIEYERYNEYSQVDSLYASKSVINNLGITDVETALGKDDHYKEYSNTANDTIKELFNDYNIKTFYLVKYSKDSFDNLIFSLTSNEEFKQYVNYLKNNLDFDDGSCKVISILEMKSDSSSNKNQFGYYKFVKSSGAAEGGGGGGGTTNNPPNKPDIEGTGLVPVVYDEDNKKWKIVKEDNPDWYNYDEQKWANAVILKNESKNADTDPYIEVDILKTAGGNTVSELDIYAMFVWIPRFSYTIGCDSSGNCLGSNDGEIDVKFVSSDVTDNEPNVEEGNFPQYTYTDLNNRNPSNWYTHPAFWWDINDDKNRDENEELSGIWAGKFLTGKRNSSPVILPNILSYNDSISEQFSFAQKIKDYSGIKGDGHMSKGSEYAAIVYLSRSKYGKFGSNNYEDSEKSVYCNNSFYLIYPSYGIFTGRSSDGTSCYTNLFTSGSSDGTYYYNGVSVDDSNSDCVECGYGASSSGSIYGVYDIGSPLGEHVMTNWKGNKGNSGFSTLPKIKYYDYVDCSDVNDTEKVMVGYGPWELRKRDIVFYDNYNWLITGIENSKVMLVTEGDSLDSSGYRPSFRITLVNPS